MKHIKPIIDSSRRANGLDFFVSDDMPSGYKTAYGTYDVTINTLFVNVNLLQNAPVYKFYLSLSRDATRSSICPPRTVR